MMRLAIFTVVAGSLMGLISHSAGAVPPATSSTIGVSHGRPFAGHLFTGFVVTPVNGAKLSSVNCDATLGGKSLPGRTRHFYETATGGTSVSVTCGWNIPAHAKGMLFASVTVITTADDSETTPMQHWRVMR